MRQYTSLDCFAIHPGFSRAKTGNEINSISTPEITWEDRKTHRHIRLATNIGLCQRFLELTGDTEIAKLDITSAANEDISRLDV